MLAHATTLRVVFGQRHLVVTSIRAVFAVSLVVPLSAATSTARPRAIAEQGEAAGSAHAGVRTPTHVAASVTWCGTDEVVTDRRPDLEVSSDNQIRVVYAVPADRPDRFTELASLIASDVGEIAAWWQREDSARVPRFDLYPFPGCTTRFGMLDLAALRLTRDSSAYAGDGGFAPLAAEVGARFPATTKTLVFYDGTPGRFVCGTSYRDPNFGGARGVAVVYLDVSASACGTDLGGGADRAATAAHELGHALGAVPPGAPHLCPSEQAAHACDGPGDIMRASHQTGAPLSAYALDVGRDDYYGHAGSWWDVQDSRWLIHLPQHQLVIRVESHGGNGTVAVRRGDLTCPDRCDATWDDGSTVELDPQPDDRSRFAGWTDGGCTGVDICELTMTTPRTVTASFAVARRALTVVVVGKGNVTLQPSGMRCRSTCRPRFDDGTTVRFTAAAAPGYRFAGWRGPCRGTRSCATRVRSDLTVRAVFKRR